MSCYSEENVLLIEVLMKTQTHRQTNTQTYVYIHIHNISQMMFYLIYTHVDAVTLHDVTNNTLMTSLNV